MASLHQVTGVDLGFENGGGGAGGVIGVLAWSVGLKLGTARPKIGGGMHPLCPPPLDPRLGKVVKTDHIYDKIVLFVVRHQH